MSEKSVHPRDADNLSKLKKGNTKNWKYGVRLYYNEEKKHWAGAVTQTGTASKWTAFPIEALGTVIKMIEDGHHLKIDGLEISAWMERKTPG